MRKLASLILTEDAGAIEVLQFIIYKCADQSLNARTQALGALKLLLMHGKVVAVRNLYLLTIRQRV